MSYPGVILELSPSYFSLSSSYFSLSWSYLRVILVYPGVIPVYLRVIFSLSSSNLSYPGINFALSWSYSHFILGLSWSYFRVYPHYFQRPGFSDVNQRRTPSGQGLGFWGSSRSRRWTHRFASIYGHVRRRSLDVLLLVVARVLVGYTCSRCVFSTRLPLSASPG